VNRSGLTKKDAVAWGLEEGVWWEEIANSTDVGWEHERSGSCPCKAEGPLWLWPWGWELVGGMGLEEETCVGKRAAGLRTVVARAGRDGVYLQ